ncbi:nitroreductase/quinone reductase family protein [Marinactinospora rubrisoli]|uniref:Nitroreductase/quinone reductase family protein n=1 Tax=Marinactinospora rubrisoli TaxID=2715399 RepID=A0ABW2KLV4_9ACTN
MAKQTKRFEMTQLRRTANAVIGGFLKFGLGPPELHLLTTRGSKSGFLRTTPVSLVDNDQGRFLVAPYGPVGWVRNIRKDGFATLRRGGWIELVSVTEVAPQRAAPVLREYLSHPRAAIVGAHFEVEPDAPVEAFAAIADAHPVFEIVRSTTVRL